MSSQLTFQLRIRWYLYPRTGSRVFDLNSREPSSAYVTACHSLIISTAFFSLLTSHMSSMPPRAALVSTPAGLVVPTVRQARIRAVRIWNNSRSRRRQHLNLRLPEQIIRILNHRVHRPSQVSERVFQTASYCSEADCIPGNYAYGPQTVNGTPGYGATSMSPCQSGTTTSLLQVQRCSVRCLLYLCLGTYSTGGAAACTPCPAGYKCTGTEQTTPQACSAGQYQPTTGYGGQTCPLCPAGTYNWM